MSDETKTVGAVIWRDSMTTGTHLAYTKYGKNKPFHRPLVSDKNFSLRFKVEPVENNLNRRRFPGTEYFLIWEYCPMVKDAAGWKGRERFIGKARTIEDARKIVDHLACARERQGR